MSKEMKFTRPLCAGLASDPKLVGMRIGQLHDALEAINANVIEQTENGIVSRCWDFKMEIMTMLKEDGWNVHYSKPQQKMKVWPKDEVKNG